MKTYVTCAAAALVCWAGVAYGQSSEGSSPAEKMGWRLAVQSYSFNHFTFFEAVDKTASVGVKYIEAYPGQKICAGRNTKMDVNLSAEDRKFILDKLSAAGVKMLSFGVVGLPKDEAGSRKVFEFAKAMGVETIVSEPAADALDTVEKLAREYNIKVAFHNHPQPSHYWNPDTVLAAVKDRSPLLGACADTGHWNRSGLVPLEQIKKLEGKIISFHFKDHQKAPRHDVPWGTGCLDTDAMLAEMHRQNFKGEFVIEYEYNWNNSLPEIAQCVKYFNETAAKLSAKSN